MHKIFILFITTYLLGVGAELKFPLQFQIDDDNSKHETDASINYRLPKTVIPAKYTILLTPYFDINSDRKFTFDGFVEIDVTIPKPEKRITLHAKELTFTKESVTLNCNNLAIKDFTGEFDKTTDFVHLDSATELKDACKIKIDYTGILNNDMRGFYRSSYKNKNNETVWLGATHFEPVGARRAFPCFDEPEFKANFFLTIVHDKKYKVISNMKSQVSLEGDQARTVFGITPKMSTYLLAFVVSDFATITNTDGKFAVHAKPTAIENGNGKLALEMGQKILMELEVFTGIQFRIPKMDQAAIPDFAAGAMENWGLVLYREKALLFDEKTSTTSDKQSIIEVIAHEFAHQWFGDLVSPKWWNYLWLNEGFANFFQSYITDEVEPEWNSVYQSVVKSIQGAAFEFDSSSKTHPINQAVESPEEINAIFDSISYQKGGAVIRMMQHFLTEPVFQLGLRAYLESKSETVAESNDLFEAFNNAAKSQNINLLYDMKLIMDNWVNKKGYPVVTVTRNYTDKSIQVEQKRFFAYNASTEEKNDNYTWYIPINYATASKVDFEDTTPSTWLKSPLMKFAMDIDANDWFIINKQQTGFYRVNYDEQNWQLIIDYLNSDKRASIHVLNRAQLMNDALALVQQEELNLQVLLRLTSYLKNETDYIAWYPAFKTMTWLKQKLIGTCHYSFFKSNFLNVMHHSVQSTGLEETKEDKYLTKLHRIPLLKWSCLLGDAQCKYQAHEKLTAWLEDSEKNPISPDLKEVVLCNGLRTANSSTWNAALEKYEKSTDSNEKSQLTTALGCSENKEILQFYLNYTVTEDSKLNDTLAVIKKIQENSIVGVDVVLDFVIQRFITLLLKIKTESTMVSLFEQIAAGVTTDSQLEKIKSTEFMDIPRRITNKGISVAERNLEWLQKNHEVLHSWEKEVTSNTSSSGYSIKAFSGFFGLTSLLFIVSSVIVK